VVKNNRFDYHTNIMNDGDDKIRQRTVVAQVMEHIRRMIASGAYRPGDKIPTEQQLAEQFGIGRSSIREAIKIFNYLGILESRTARGTYLCDHTSISTEALTWSVLLGSHELHELIDIRGALELWSTLKLSESVAAGHQEAIATLEQLRELIGQMRATGSTPREESRIDADYEFHNSIIKSGGNEIFTSIYSTLRAFMREEIRLSQDDYLDPRVIADEHEAIVDAIASGSREVAQVSCMEHIDNIKRRLRVQVESR